MPRAEWESKMIRNASLIKRLLAWIMKKYVERGDSLSSPAELKRYPDDLLVETFNDVEQLILKMEDLDEDLFSGDDEKKYDFGMNWMRIYLERIKEEAKNRPGLKVNSLNGKEYIIKASLKISCRG